MSLSNILFQYDGTGNLIEPPSYSNFHVNYLRTKGLFVEGQIVGPSGPYSGATGAQGPTGPVGPTGPSSGGVSESFTIAIPGETGLVNSADPIPGPFIDTINPGIVPGVDPNFLFNSLSVGTLNLSTGYYTCGISGKYLVSLNGYQTAPVSGIFALYNVTDGSYFPLWYSQEMVLNLVAGNVYYPTYLTTDAGQFNFTFWEQSYPGTSLAGMYAFLYSVTFLG